MRDEPISDRAEGLVLPPVPAPAGPPRGRVDAALPGHAAACPTSSRQVAPGAKLLTIVREPVERYRSGLNQWHEREPSAARSSATRRPASARRDARLLWPPGPAPHGGRRPRAASWCCSTNAARSSRPAQFARTLRVPRRRRRIRPDPRLLKTRVNQTVGDKRSLSSKDEAGAGRGVRAGGRSCSSSWCRTSTSRCGRASRTSSGRLTSVTDSNGRPWAQRSARSAARGGIHAQLR